MISALASLGVAATAEEIERTSKELPPGLSEPELIRQLFLALRKQGQPATGARGTRLSPPESYVAEHTDHEIEPAFGDPTMPDAHENPSNDTTQKESAKLRLVSRISRLIRRAGIDYEGWRYVSARVRKECSLKPAKKGRRLPKVLTQDDFRRFYEVVDRADDAQHSLMLRLLFYTGVRVSELCNMEVGQVDLEACKIRIEHGKGDKDRYVLFGKSFATALRTHIAAHPDNRWLFQTRRNSRYSARRVQQIVTLYAEKAGVKASPHTFRHQAITYLTRHSGLADAELQLITGHARRETLAIYQHVALDGDIQKKYEEAIRGAGL